MNNTLKKKPRTHPHAHCRNSGSQHTHTHTHTTDEDSSGGNQLKAITTDVRSESEEAVEEADSHVHSGGAHVE
jgi:hypothetical protein